MTLANYISDLLYRYECVIVPGFGGFVTNEISAKVNHFTHTFYPPSKQLTFNGNLKSNDGLLVNYFSQTKNIPYAEALKEIEEAVSRWKSVLTEEELELDKIGSMHLNKSGNIVFEPNSNVNYLTDSFGMSSFVSPAVKRLAYKEQVRQLKTTTPAIPTTENKKKSSGFIKYAAAAAIVLAMGTVGFKEYQKATYNNMVAEATLQQEKVDKKIQEATFVIDNPLPSITLNVVKETYNFHVIAGAFRDPANADKKLQELVAKGYEARILGLNKSKTLTQVAYSSFNSRYEALKSLEAIKENESAEAWLLVQKY